MERVRVAYLVTHPIQYQAPLLRAIAADPDIDLKVFFCSDLSTRQYADPGFGTAVAWDVPLLGGYAHEFLPVLGARDDRLTFWRPFNYGLSRRLRQGRFDVVWLHGYARWTNWMAMAAAKALGIKVLLRDEAWEGGTKRSSFKRLSKRVFFRSLRRLCDGFLAIGSLNRAYYLSQGIPEHRIYSVPYAVDNARFRAGAEAAVPGRAALRQSLGLEPGRPIVLFAAKFELRKRPDDLVAAFARIADHPALRRPYLLLIGAGAMGPALEAQVQRLGGDSIKLLGFKNQSELPAYYDLCDVFVLPSFNEPWGLAVNEAMNAGRAIVVSDQVGAGPDLVRDGDNGLIFRAGDIDDLARALRTILTDAESCAAMGRRSLELIAHWGFREDIAGLKSALAGIGPIGRRSSAARGFLPSADRD